MKKIASIKLRRILDESPDLSFLGEYSAHPGDDEKTIDREERILREFGFSKRAIAAAVRSAERGD